MLGCSANNVRYHAGLLGLSMADKSSAYRERVSEKRSLTMKARGIRPKGHRKNYQWTTDSKAKLSATRRRMYASERRRLLFNLPQKTRYKIKL